MADNYYWEYWLRPNTLTKDDDEDCIAEVQTSKETLRNEELADAIMKAGSEISRDTVLSIINRRDSIVREHLLLGHSVLTNVCQLTPRITGNWATEESPFDPAIHKLTLDIVPSAMMREDLKKVKLSFLGVKSETARIGSVTDTFTGLTDGTITAEEDIRIDGNKIKVMGDESLAGVFFVSEDGAKTLPVTRRFTQNDPSCIIARVPRLDPGNYTLRIVTFFQQGKLLLKTARIIEYRKLLTVSGDGDKPGEL